MEIPVSFCLIQISIACLPFEHVTDDRLVAKSIGY